MVTGGGGFIGANLVQRLILLGYDVHLIWKESTDPWRLKDLSPKLKFHKVSLLNKKGLTNLVSKIKPLAIFHLAAHGAYPSQTDAGEIVKVNILGTLNLLEASKNTPYQIFVNTGSSSEYGIKTKSMKETDNLEPLTFYAASKAAVTLLCQVFAKEYQKPIVTVRPFSAYGPYEEKTRFIPTAICRLLKNKTVKITGNNVRHDFVFVEDVVDAYIALLKKKEKVSGKIINLGTGFQYTNCDVVDTIGKLTGKRVQIKKEIYVKRVWDTPFWVADTKLAKKLLNWQARHSLEKGLAKTIDWISKHKSFYNL